MRPVFDYDQPCDPVYQFVPTESVAGDGLVQTNRQQLAGVLRDLLGDPQRRNAMAENGRTVLRQQQGATDRNAELIRKAIGH